MMIGFQECITHMTDATLVVVIENYFSRHPEAVTQPLVMVGLNSLREACADHLEK
jgi:hypothetical protein